MQFTELTMSRRLTDSEKFRVFMAGKTPDELRAMIERLKDVLAPHETQAVKPKRVRPKKAAAPEAVTP